MLSWRSRKGVREMQSDKILEATGLPMPLIDRIHGNRNGRYSQEILFC